jgi:hypothetical protein
MYSILQRHEVDPILDPAWSNILSDLCVMTQALHQTCPVAVNYDRIDVAACKVFRNTNGIIAAILRSLQVSTYCL